MSRVLKWRHVKKPRKTHVCSLCHEAITGPHVYYAEAECDAGFMTVRRHEECQALVAENCHRCPAGMGCEYDMDECLREYAKDFCPAPGRIADKIAYMRAEKRKEQGQ